jgi:hypothetical protein
VDFLAEFGTLDPWLYRGWAYLLSSPYRQAPHDAWKKAGRLYAFSDIAFSGLVMVLEMVLVGVVAYWLVSPGRGAT